MSEGGLEDFLNTKLVCSEFNKLTFKMKALEKGLLTYLKLEPIIKVKAFYMHCHGDCRSYSEQVVFFKDYINWLNVQLSCYGVEAIEE